MGIGLVNPLHSRSASGRFLPLDFRICAPDEDKLIGNQCFQVRFAQVIVKDKVRARTVLFDS
jgi:hypothetical protein